jgi:hypothetical protein
MQRAARTALFATLMTFSQAGAGTVSLTVLRVAERRAARRRRPRPSAAVVREEPEAEAEASGSHPE